MKSRVVIAAFRRLHVCFIWVGYLKSHVMPAGKPAYRMKHGHNLAELAHIG